MFKKVSKTKMWLFGFIRGFQGIQKKLFRLLLYPSGIPWGIERKKICKNGNNRL
jgi:hypothetical protein